MYVWRTPGVVTREDGGEGCNTKFVGLLDTTEEGGVEVIWILVSISTGNNSSVDSSAIASYVAVSWG